MTASGFITQTGFRVLRVTFIEPEGIVSFEHLLDKQLVPLRELLTFLQFDTATLAAAQRDTAHLDAVQEAGGKRVIDLVPPVQEARNTAVRSTQVLRISLSSPLEVELAIGMAASSLLVLANRWAVVRANLARSREQVAGSNLRAEATGVVLEMLRRQSVTPELEAYGSRLLDAVIQGSVTALTQIESIRPLDDLDAP